MNYIREKIFPEISVNFFTYTFATSIAWHILPNFVDMKFIKSHDDIFLVLLILITSEKGNLINVRVNV